MMNKSIKSTDIDRWVANGLIDQRTALSLREDMLENSNSSRFSYILLVIASVFIAFALITFVAANWQELPRVFRVCLIFVVIFSGYVLGAWCKIKGSHGLSELGFLIGAIGFGSGIALIGQIYHISGDTIAALKLWLWVTLITAFLLRSSLLSVLSIILSIVLMCSVVANDYVIVLFAGLNFNTANIPIILENTLLLILTYVLCWWTISQLSRHIWLLMLVFYCIEFTSSLDLTVEHNAGYYIAIPFIILFLIDWLNPKLSNQFLKIPGSLGNWSLIYAYIALWFQQVILILDGAFYSKIAAVIIVILSLCALWSGRKRGVVTTVIAIVGLIAEVYLLLWNELSSLMAQSLFFFVVAIIIFIMARVALMKRGHL